MNAVAGNRRPTRERLWRLLEPLPGDRAGHAVGLVLAGIIVLAVLGNILSNEPGVPRRFAPVFSAIEMAATLVFLVEYLCRLASCTADPAYDRPWGRLAWALSPLAVIDFLALASGLLWFVDVNLAFLRVVRMVRLLKLTRYSAGLQLIAATFSACKRELAVVATGLLVVLFIAASILNLAERSAQPDTFGSFFTSLWWAVCTLTTVGYGDVYPVTTFGRFSAALIAVAGIGSFAIPSGIIAAHFNNILRKRTDTIEE